VSFEKSGLVIIYPLRSACYGYRAEEASMTGWHQKESNVSEFSNELGFLTLDVREEGGLEIGRIF